MCCGPSNKCDNLVCIRTMDGSKIGCKECCNMHYRQERHVGQQRGGTGRRGGALRARLPFNLRDPERRGRRWLRQRQRPQQLVVGSTTSVWGGDRQLERPVVAAVNHDCVNPCNFAPWNVFLVRHCPPGSPHGVIAARKEAQQTQAFCSKHHSSKFCVFGGHPPLYPFVYI